MATTPSGPCMWRRHTEPMPTISVSAVIPKASAQRAYWSANGPWMTGIGMDMPRCAARFTHWKYLAIVASTRRRHVAASGATCSSTRKSMAL